MDVLNVKKINMENQKEKSSELNLYIFRQSYRNPDFSYYRTIAVISSDVIGAGIAHVSIDKDFQVILYDTTLNGLSRGQSQIVKGYENYIKRNRIAK